MPARTRPEVETTLPLLLDVHDVARLIGRSAATVYRWRAAGDLPTGVLVAGCIRWTREEIEEWLASLRT